MTPPVPSIFVYLVIGIVNCNEQQIDGLYSSNEDQAFLKVRTLSSTTSLVTLEVCSTFSTNFTDFKAGPLQEKSDSDDGQLCPPEKKELENTMKNVLIDLYSMILSSDGRNYKVLVLWIFYQ